MTATMGVMTELRNRERAIRDIVLLRRAEQDAPQREVIASVRRNLERQVGATITRAMAARLLGVSQTALDRWIATGDVPTVVSPRGRREIPVFVVVDLIDAVERQRAQHPEDRHPLASMLQARRARAAAMDVDELLPAAVADGATGHRRAEVAGLAYHRLVARRLDREMVEQAQDRLRDWVARGLVDDRRASEWERLLARPIDDIARAIEADTPTAQDLRQSSPFAGMVPDVERRRVLDRAVAR